MKRRLAIILSLTIVMTMAIPVHAEEIIGENISISADEIAEEDRAIVSENEENSEELIVETISAEQLLLMEEKLLMDDNNEAYSAKEDADEQFTKMLGIVQHDLAVYKNGIELTATGSEFDWATSAEVEGKTVIGDFLVIKDTGLTVKNISALPTNNAVVISLENAEETECVVSFDNVEFSNASKGITFSSDNGKKINIGFIGENVLPRTVFCNHNITVLASDSDATIKLIGPMMFGGTTGYYSYILSGCNGKILTIEPDYELSGSEFRPIAIRNNHSLTMNSGTVLTGKPTTSPLPSGGMINVPKKAKFTMYGGEISNASALKGGAVYVNGTFNMNGGTIKDCEATGGNGGAVCAEGIYETGKYGTFNMNGGIIQDCSATGNGGAIYSNTYEYDGSYGTRLSNEISIQGTISNCSAEGMGGAVYVERYAKLSIKKATIENCNAYLAGGAVYSYSADGINIEESMIKDCTVYGEEDADGVMKSKGGALYLYNGNNSITKATISNCRASLPDGAPKQSYARGGAVYVMDIASLSLNNTSIMNNQADNEGGGIFSRGKVTLQNKVALEGNGNTNFFIDAAHKNADGEQSADVSVWDLDSDSRIKVSASKTFDLLKSQSDVEAYKTYFSADEKYLLLEEGQEKLVIQPVYTVMFNANIPGYTGTMTPKQVAYGEIFTVPGNGFAGVPSGYTFIGWGLTSDATPERAFTAGSKIENITGDIILYAIWNVSHSSTSTGTTTLFTGTWGNPVSDGKWTYNITTDSWTYASSRMFTNTWGYIVNPYANILAGQHTADWFYFDSTGKMLTGWQWLPWNRTYRCYYLNDKKDNTLGACLIGPAITPDGYTVDGSGAWTVNGVIQER